MKLEANAVRFSPTDLAQFMESRFASWMSRYALDHPEARPGRDRTDAEALVDADDLLKRREGSEASVNGATQIRAGVMRPEVTIPINGKVARSGEAAVDATTGLGVGLPVRLIRHPYFGKLGTVSGMPSEPHVLDSGSKARVLEVEFKDGTRAIVPRANVEIIEG